MKLVMTHEFDFSIFSELEKQGIQIQKLNTSILSPENMKEAHILLIRSRTQINDSNLEHGHHLKLIITATSGYDHIDLMACKKRGILVSHTPNAHITSAAEITLLLTLNLLKKIPLHHKALTMNYWRDSVSRGQEIANKKIGIVGLGRIGSRVAELFQAFGAEEIKSADPYKEDSYFQEKNIQRLSYTELLKWADLISFHVPATAETHHMINRQTLEITDSDTFLINASRGNVFCEDSILQALYNGELGGVGLDVFATEPLRKDSPLRQHPHVVITPHLGGYTHEALFKASYEALTKIKVYITRGIIDEDLTDNT